MLVAVLIRYESGMRSDRDNPAGLLYFFRLRETRCLLMNILKLLTIKRNSTNSRPW